MEVLTCLDEWDSETKLTQKDRLDSRSQQLPLLDFSGEVIRTEMPCTKQYSCQNGADRKANASNII